MEIEETLSDLTRSTATLDYNRSRQETIENLPVPELPPGGLLEIYRRAIAELSRHCISIGMLAEELVEQCPVKVEPVPDYMKPVRNNWQTWNCTAQPCGRTASSWKKCGAHANWTTISILRKKN
jgi:hypothetical protein